MKYEKMLVAGIIVFLMAATFAIHPALGISGSALFMKSNSTAKIYADYTFRAPSNQTWTLNPEIFTSMTDSNSQAKDITIVASPSSFTGNINHTKVIFTITAKGDSKGVYSLLLFFCGSSPLVVGLNESEVDPATLKEFFTAIYMCPMMTASTPDLNIVGYSGMVSKDITINPNNTINVTSTERLEVFDSPLTQYKSGIKTDNVKCNTGLELVIKAEDGSPACVSPDTANVLIERGWATNISQTNPAADLASDTGIVTLGNQTYYFETPIYPKNVYVNPTSVLFHEINFTLFPSGFRGGLPIPCNTQGSDQYYWTDAKFTDTTHELLHIQVDSLPCTANPIPSMFSTHTNPQAGLAFYDGKMKLLVSTSDTNPRLDFTTNSSSIQSGHAIGINISLNNTGPEPLTLAVEDHWPHNDLSLGSCSNLPIGIDILRGYYTEQNMSEAGSLWLYPNLPCPLPLGTTGYTFQPMSNVATRECSPSFSCHDSIAIEGNLAISGYLSGNGNVTPFESGIYTIVGGDEWGDIAIRHFAVTNNTNPLGITALVIYHPFLGCLGPCPPNNFYLKINSNSSAYLFGYDICNGQSCVRNDTLSVPLPLNSSLKPEYAQVWLPQDVMWHDGDTVHIQLSVSSLPDNRTGTPLDLGNSTIVP
jgi:hypothetical protein